MTFSGPLGRWLTKGADLDPDGFLPAGFEASVRVLHPPRCEVGVDVWEPVTWAEIAAHNGKAVNDPPTWDQITGVEYFHSNLCQPGLWEDEPWEGGVPPIVLPALVNVLARHTAPGVSTYVGVWYGFGDRRSSSEIIGEAVLEELVLPGRQYDVFPATTAGVHRLVEAGSGPNLWWPADHTWCATTEIDSKFTAVGGSQALIDDLTATGFRRSSRRPSPRRTLPAHARAFART